MPSRSGAPGSTRSTTVETPAPPVTLWPSLASRIIQPSFSAEPVSSACDSSSSRNPWTRPSRSAAGRARSAS